MSEQKPAPQPEPWLSGTLAEEPVVARAVLHALELAKEDVYRWIDTLTGADLHEQPHGITSIAFHLRHIVRSLDRLLTYAEGNQLSSDQIVALKTESDPEASRDELFAEFDEGMQQATQRIRALGKTNLDQQRGVGKKQLPTTVGGLLVHCADHTQRHVGQIVTTAKVLIATNAV